jgi:hypothetical protein
VVRGYAYSPCCRSQRRAGPPRPDTVGVSRPYLTPLLKTGKLPYRKKGNRHLVPAAALEQFKVERDRHLDELDTLAAAEADLGLR